MKRLIDLQSDAEFAELDEILKKIRHGQINATLKQGSQNKDDTYSYIDIQKVSSDANPLLQINDNYVYIIIRNGRTESVKRIKSLWDTLLQRGTQRSVQGLPNDYVLILDCLRYDERTEWYHGVTCVQPIMVSTDADGTLTMCFDISDVNVTKEIVSTYAVDEEIAYRESIGDIPDLSDFGVDERNVPVEEETDETVGSFLDSSKFTSF